jgi:RNA-directed DNA polymerase
MTLRDRTGKGSNAMTGRVYYSLYDRMLHEKRLKEAFLAVKKSGGCGGIDRQEIKDFEKDLANEIGRLVTELRSKTYEPAPVLRVEIPKDNGKVRLLGIPTVRDRVVQQALLSILQPIYEEHFHPSSYGYRPGRSCHQAISKATTFIRKYELTYAVDMDLSRCFDTLNHELIITFMRKRVTDGSILNLVKQFLTSGVMNGDILEEVEEGSPQGGVISPLLANIYLNEFDQFMKGRGYRIVRYADDILILRASLRSANHAMEVATRYLEKTLKLKVNKDKTHIATCCDGIRFLGVIITCKYTYIQEKKLEEFKVKVRKITRRTQGTNLESVIRRLNPVLRGFSHYFKIANCKKVFMNLMSWIRRRLRAIQLKLWKKPDRLHRRLRQLGYHSDFKKIRMNSWRNAVSPQACYSMPNRWLLELGLFDMASLDFGFIVPC